ncbi:hypothetical protein BD410DRAFT_284455 [Rickenella mellea]|uniref:Uncharacterized protein n=1 Tax=Rickenella mellea TaxID=50990 RepID=A0A4Y7Q419_9AGAM|nr:hypothetical protein BD410DRAFT_284455 [Rickenella mellea]
MVFAILLIPGDSGVPNLCIFVVRCLPIHGSGSRWIFETYYILQRSSAGKFALRDRSANFGGVILSLMVLMPRAVSTKTNSVSPVNWSKSSPLSLQMPNQISGRRYAHEPVLIPVSAQSKMLQRNVFKTSESNVLFCIDDCGVIPNTRWQSERALRRC